MTDGDDIPNTSDVAGEMDSDRLREYVESGASPHLLAMTAPDLPLAIEAFTYEYGRMAQVSHDAWDDADAGSSKAYWKGRMDAYASVRGELASALMRYEHVDSAPYLAAESEYLFEAFGGESDGDGGDGE